MSRGGAAGERTFHASPAFLVRAVDMGEADRRLTFFTARRGRRVDPREIRMEEP
jgi:hypothetical protein